MRITVQRLPYRKIVSQLGKREELSSVKAKLQQTKVTLSPKLDSILWDPSPDLCKSFAEILEREQTFARQKDSANYKLIEANIARLRKHSASEAEG